MAIAIDTRTHVIGDLMMVTGTFGAENDNVEIDLSSHLSKIFHFSALETSGTAQTLKSSIAASGTSVRLTETGNTGGVWMAIGQR